MTDAKRIAELEAELQQAKDTLALSNAKNSGEMLRLAEQHNAVVEENNALKAQSVELKAFINMQSDNCFDKIERGGVIIRPKVDAHNAIHKAPKQCLADVRAKAVKAFGHQIGLYDSEYDDQEYIEVSRGSLRDHIEQLRDNKQ